MLANLESRVNPINMHRMHWHSLTCYTTRAGSRCTRLYDAYLKETHLAKCTGGTAAGLALAIADLVLDEFFLCSADKRQVPCHM